MNRMRLLFSLVSLFLISMSLNITASAQCGAMPKHVLFPLLRGPDSSRFKLIAATQNATLNPVSDEWGSEYGQEPIVGLWKMDFEDPADHYSDKGYSMWHGDHTEFMNSTRPPSTGAVCQGVWERVGRYTYKLNHFALGYGDGVNLTSVYRFVEVVDVEPSGNKFSGEFTIEAFDPKTHSPQGTFKGTVSGEKININTTINSQNF